MSDEQRFLTLISARAGGTTRQDPPQDPIANDPSFGGGGGGDGGSGIDMATKDYIDAKLETARAERREDMARIEGQLGVLMAEVTSRPTTGTVLFATFTSAITIIGIVVAVLAYGGDRFDGGVQMTGAVVEDVVENREAVQSNAEAIEAVDDKLDLLLDVLRPSNAPSSD